MNKFMMTVVAGSLLTLLGNNVFAAEQAAQQAIAPTNNEVLTAPTHDAPPATTDNSGNSSIADSMATDATQQPAAANPGPQTTTTTTEVKTAPNAAQATTDSANAAMANTATPTATNPAPQTTTITTETRTAPNAAQVTTDGANATMTNTATPAATNPAPQTTTITTETRTAPNATMTNTASPTVTNPAPQTTTTTTEIKATPNTMQPATDATNAAMSNTAQPPAAAPWNKPLDLKTINCQYVLPDTEKNFTTPELQAWASYASTASFTYDYQNYKDDFAKLQSCFTNNGWQSFHQALTKSGNLIVIDKEKLSVSAKAGEPVTVEQLQTNNNRNTWKISLPLNVVYKGAQVSAQQNLDVTLRITQTKNAAGKDIIGIEQLIAAPQKTDAVNSAEPAIAPKN